MSMGRAWIELDAAALRGNVEALSALLPSGCALMPVLKANAYGHGAALIGRELNRLGMDAFCVATAREGEELRKNGVLGELLVLGYTPPEQFELLSFYDLTQTVTDRVYAELLNGSAGHIRAQIKIDTGMHRLGERWNDLEDIMAIFACGSLDITGVYTHLCAAGSTSPRCRDVTETQSARFFAAVERLRGLGCRIPCAHLLSSYGLINYPELGGDRARVGIALYGLLSQKDDGQTCPVPLRPVLSLKAEVAHILELRRGESAGYDLSFVAGRPSRLAVLAIGYADGLPRSLSRGVGAALLHGQKAPVAGSICMDQMMVDVTDIPEVRSGDTAVLIGRCGELEIGACDLAEQAGTISNEILSRLGPRLGRFMVMHGDPCAR